jgi:Zn-dependent protease with chaperone function
MVGFYVLAFSIVAILLFIPYASVQPEHVNAATAKVGLFCIVGACIILWSIVPRVDRFVVPGLIVSAGQHPKLFEAINRIGHATNQFSPSEVYLTNEMNAWVTNRGGVMGIGSRRVMGIGLPLMAALSTSQLRAVLAHEFGHYYGGDTKLGPWIYKTRAAIGRTIYELEKNDSVLRFPFQAYGRSFIRITHAISRQQEFAADELAARTVGARPLIEGLQVIHTNGQAFMPYFLNEVIPVLQNGFLPPVLDGFRHFTASPAIVKALAEGLDQEMAASKDRSQDTHPPLHERLLKLEKWSQQDSDDSNDSALSLLENAAEVEAQLMGSIVNLTSGQELRSISWNEVGSKVWIPLWEARAKPYLAQLSGATVGKLGDLCRNPMLFSPRSDHLGNPLAPEAQRQLGILTLGSMFALALHANDWNLHISLGEQASLERNNTRISPFAVVTNLSIGLMTAESWHQLCVSCGIADLSITPKLAVGLNESAPGSLV